MLASTARALKRVNTISFAHPPKKNFMKNGKKLLIATAATLPIISVAAFSKYSKKQKEAKEVKPINVSRPVITIKHKFSELDAFVHTFNSMILAILPVVSIPAAISWFLSYFYFFVIRGAMKTLSNDFSLIKQAILIRKLKSKFPNMRINESGICAGLTAAYLSLKEIGVDLIQELREIEFSIDHNLEITIRQKKIIDLFIMIQNNQQQDGIEITFKKDNISPLYFDNDNWKNAQESASKIIDSMTENRCSQADIVLFMDSSKRDLKTQFFRLIYGDVAHAIGVFRKNKRIGLFDSNNYAADFNEDDLFAAKESLAYMIYNYNKYAFTAAIAINLNLGVRDARNKKIKLEKHINDDSSSEVNFNIPTKLLPRPRKR